MLASRCKSLSYSAISGLATHIEILDEAESIIVGTTRSQIFIWAPKNDQDRLSYTSTFLYRSGGNIESILSFTLIKNGSDINKIVSSGLASNGTLFIEIFDKNNLLLETSYNSKLEYLKKSIGELTDHRIISSDDKPEN